MGREKCEEYPKNKRNLLLFGGGGKFPSLNDLKKTLTAHMNCTHTWRSHDPHLKTVHQHILDFASILSLLLCTVSNLVNWLEFYRNQGGKSETE